MNYRSNERNTEIVERLEKLEARFEDLASRVRYNKAEDKSKVPGYASNTLHTG